MDRPGCSLLYPAQRRQVESRPLTGTAILRIGGVRNPVPNELVDVGRIFLGILALVLGGCGSLPRNAVPPELTGQAVVAQMPDIRATAGQPSPAMERDLRASFAQERAGVFPISEDGSVLYAHLALSGGGASGAFGAGFLNGWTSTGSRPAFKIVTGVSTGALMAPFAFLGSAYDGALREFYTTTRTRDIFVLGSLLRQLLYGDALADTRPLRALIERHVDGDFMRKIGEAHLQGRRLYIGTADLDSRQFIVWNMGLIAISGRAESLELFHKIMLASASIPVAFPPVFFEVEVDGRRYDEMHVDGGVGARVFFNEGLYSSSIVRTRGGLGKGREDIYVIHNGQLVSVPDPVRRSLPSISMRVIDFSGRSAVVGDLFRIYGDATREQANFRWVTIPDDVSMESDEVFDPTSMTALYDIGYRLAVGRNAWAVMPPGRQQGYLH